MKRGEGVKVQPGGGRGGGRGSGRQPDQKKKKVAGGGGDAELLTVTFEKETQ